MYNLFRTIILLRSPSSVFTHGFSESPLKSLRCLSTSSEIVSSPKSISFASSDVQLKNKRKTVIAFLKNQGFSESQISDLAKTVPEIFSANLKNTLLPKFLFLQYKGLSSPEIVKFVCATPSVLNSSLLDQIIPAFDYMEAVLGTEESAVAAIKRFARIIALDVRFSVGPNIELLKKIGVPDSSILTYLQYQPSLFLTNTYRFKEMVERVAEMGFDPQQLKFIVGIFGVRSMTKSAWDKKVELYRKWGLSEEEISLAFRRNPCCMVASEDKINATIDFFVNKMGWELSVIARRPGLFAYSLKKRIMPRSYVYKVLLSKGLIKKKPASYLFFSTPNNCFIKKFINPHKEKIPGLLESYEQKLMDSRR